MPARFRARLGEKFYITRGLHGCLWVFSERAWTRLRDQLTSRSMLSDQAVTLQRFFFGSAAECVPDKQGRVAIPTTLLELAGISCGDSVLIMGIGEGIEIWSKARWKDFNARITDQAIADFAMEAFGL